VMLQIVVEVAAGTVCDADCSIFSQTPAQLFARNVHNSNGLALFIYFIFI